MYCEKLIWTSRRKKIGYFSFDMRNSIKDLFSFRSASPFLLTTIVEKILIVCTTLNEYPHVSLQDSTVCQPHLTQQSEHEKDWGGDSPRKRATICSFICIPNSRVGLTTTAFHRDPWRVASNVRL